MGDLGGKDLSFAIKQTAYPIDPATSHYKVKSDYLLIFMAKAKQGNKWSHITHSEKVAADSKSKAMDPKPDASKDPSAGLMDMMKKMYEEGDDEMKRTIAKAWTGPRQEGHGRNGWIGRPLNLIDHDEYCGIFQPILSFFEFLFQPASMQTKNIMIFDRIEIAVSAYYTTMKFRRGRAVQPSLVQLQFLDISHPYNRIF